MVVPSEKFVHGRDGPTVTVPARVAAILALQAGLNRFYRDHRGQDPELDAVLAALQLVGHEWRERLGAAVPVALQAAELSTGQAAKRVGISERAIRQAIDSGRLTARLVGGRYVLDPTDVEHFRAIRTLK